MMEKAKTETRRAVDDRRPKIPTKASVVEMVGMLLGRRVTLETDTPDATIPDGGYVGAYVSDDGRLGAIAYGDLKLAAYTGAALAMVPPKIAEEDIQAGKLSDELRDNFYEILNVMAALFPDCGGPHVRLKKLICSPIPPTVTKANAKALARIGMRLNIEGYASGVLSVAVF